MEIDANLKWSPVSGPTPTGRPQTDAPAAADGDSFASSTALETALNNTPDVRPEAVANGRELADNPEYPSDATVKTLSNFLASQFQAGMD